MAKSQRSVEEIRKELDPLLALPDAAKNSVLKSIANLEVELKKARRAENSLSSEDVEDAMQKLYVDKFRDHIKYIPSRNASEAAYLLIRNNFETWEVERIFVSDEKAIFRRLSRFLYLEEPIREMAALLAPGSKKGTTAHMLDAIKQVVAFATTSLGHHVTELKDYSNSREDVCLKYLDISQIAPGPTTAWDQWLERIDLPDVFLAWVWGVFDFSDRGRQVLWIQDPGNTGKSAMARVLQDWLGESLFAAFNAAKLNERFSMAQYVGKRLLTDTDSKNFIGVSNENVHKITGGDYVPTEEKHRPVDTKKIFAKMLFCANYLPVLDTSRENEKSRVLLIKVSKRKNSEMGLDLSWEENLHKEKWALLYKAKEAYVRICKNSTISSAGMNWAELSDPAFNEFKTWFYGGKCPYILLAGEKTPFTKLMDDYWNSYKNKNPSEQKKIAVYHMVLRHFMERGCPIQNDEDGIPHVVGVAGKDSVQPIL